MAHSQQSTFGNVTVNDYNGDRECDGCIGFREDGTPKKCNNTASITIMRHSTGIAEFYCNIHKKDSWDDI